ncbi:SusC/RagA family TonB-linked outer membrane protein [Sphingobacterium paucimobilis]|uniref:SusC/RagA family TonB-linked outer membrane protein n=1 Tax=Sphingobacterium paucimobilis TaxID=1385985 RepID=UPI000408674B|nr:SusC/RagA family TonB-linked outer membrane protein [Sphingobacterium paucimobilis]
MITICFIGLIVNSSFAAGVVQQSHVVGRVSDVRKAPIHGVLVEDVDGSNKTYTDKNGQYSIEVASSTSKLRFSHVAFDSKEVGVGSKTIINLTLAAKKTALNEVVNLNYYNVAKRNTTGALGYMDMESLKLAPVTRFDEALAGRVAGLRVIAPQGQPGDPLAYVVRGENSVQHTQPLLVVDGIPVENHHNLVLNTDDIANLTVLKDASQLALYGSRGGNGVILIETNKGFAGKSSIKFNSFLGFQNIAKQMDMMSPYEFVRYQIELDPEHTKPMYTPADLIPGSVGYDSQGRVLMNYKDIDGIDWQDEVFRNALIQRYSLSLSGGDANTKFVSSTSFSDQKGVLMNSGAKTYQGRVNLTQRIGRFINSGFGINYGKRPRNGQLLNFEEAVDLSTYSLYRMWGARPVSGDNNIDILTPFLDPDYNKAPQIKYNPVVSLENEQKKRANSNLLSHIYLDFDILPNLKAKAQGSFLSDMVDGTGFYNTKTPSGSGANGVNGTSYYSKTRQSTLDFMLSYNEVFKRDHTLDVQGGYSYNKGVTEAYAFDVTHLPNEGIGEHGFDEGLPVYTLSKKWDDRYSSFYLRGGYNFRYKYFLSGVLRGDEVIGNKFVYSPAIALSWDMKNEDFLRNSKTISSSKLRASYGRSGIRMMNSLTPVFATNIIAPEGTLWEAVDQLDIGYDLGLWGDRLIVNLDYYDKVNSADSRFYSAARIENRGIEIGLTSVNINRPNLKWRSHFNISFNRNRVLSVHDRSPTMSSMFISDSPLYTVVPGKALAMFYGYQFDGVYQVEDFDENNGVYTLKSDISGNGSFRANIQPGDIRYVDQNSDGFIDEEDQVTLGSSMPKYFGGFNNSVNYKSFDLNIFFQWSYGNKVFNGNRMAFEGNYLQQTGLNQYASYQERWTPENRSQTLFRTGGQGEAGMLSDRTLEDGSYLRLKTVSLGYTLPKKWLKVKSVKDLRLSCSAQNLLTFTKYKGMDPEVSVGHSILTQGFDYGAYPQFRTVSFGLNATF